MQRLRVSFGLLVTFCLLLLWGCGSKASDAASPKTSPPPSAELASLSPAEPAVPAKLRLASSLWAPFTDEPGKPRFAIELVHRALERVGVEVETSLLEILQLLPAIHAGEFDGSESLWKTPERERELLFSDPYLENRLVLLARYGTDVSVASLADLKGKPVGLVEGYAYGPVIDQAEGVLFVWGKDEPANLEALLKKKLDYMLVDELMVYHLFTTQKAKAEALLAAGQKPLITRGLHFAVRRELPGAETVISRFNTALRELARDGTYNAVLSAGWIAVDSDQDGRVELVASSPQVGTAPPERHYRLYGPPAQGGPHFVVEGRAYEDWQSVPERYKVPPKEGLDRFQPAMGLVLLEF
jgi:polar amino acid transport system substrate-binding protein